MSLAERERELPALDREAANLRAAVDTLLAVDPDNALRLCVLLWPFWLRRIDLSEGDRRLSEALDAAPQRTLLRADALLARAALQMRAGNLVDGAAFVRESLDIAVEIGDRHAEWRALHMAGGFDIAKDDGVEATRWFELGLALARSQRFAAEEATCIHSLGVAHWTLGDLTAADELLTESAAAFRAAASSWARVPSPINIGELRDDAPDGIPAHVVFEETLQPFFEISCDAAVGYALANQAGIARILGDHARARALLDESEDRFTEIGDERGNADVQARRAYLELAEGSFETAQRGLDRALRLWRRLNDRRAVGLGLVGLCRVHIAAGRLDQAERHLAEACDIFRRAGDRWGLASALWRAADVGFARGRLDEAETALNEATRVLEDTGRDRWTAHTLAGLAEAANLRGETDRAAALFVQARDLYAGKNDTPAVAHVEARLRELGGAQSRR